MTVDSYLRVEDVSHRYADGTHVLQDVSFSVPPGAFVTLVGPSGVGKSTLLRMLGGLLQPSSGRVLLGNAPPADSLHPVGVVFQRDNLMPWRTAYENVRLPLELGNGKRNGDVERRVRDLLKLVGLAGFEQNYPAQLSGGMAQRVALARALVHEPELLLLDEPFGALDALTRERMGQELLRIWQAMPVTVFMVTHSISEAVLLSDEILVMNGFPGEITLRIPVPLPRPRTQELQFTPAFVACSQAVRDAIKGDRPEDLPGDLAPPSVLI